jgi:hypothetical protein
MNRRDVCEKHNQARECRSHSSFRQSLITFAGEATYNHDLYDYTLNLIAEERPAD